MQTGIKIGHDQKTITDVGGLIRYIIDAPTGERVKMAALEAMKETLTITNISVSNCHVEEKTHNHYAEQDEESATND